MRSWLGIGIVGALLHCSSSKEDAAPRRPPAAPVRATEETAPADAGAIDAAPSRIEQARACVAKKNRAACEACCDEVYPDGYHTMGLAMLACMCVPSLCEGPCRTSMCATPPVDPPADDEACTRCLNDAFTPADGGDGPCAASVVNTCAVDDACMRWARCTDECAGD